MRIKSPGHAAFAATMIFLGILCLTKGDFSPIWAPVPKSVPAHKLLAYLCGFVSLLCGIGLLWQRTAAVASRVLLAYFVLWLLLLRLAFVLPHPSLLGFWSCGETAVMTAGAWVLYVWFAGDQDKQRFGFATGDTGLRIARALYGLSLIPFGLAHFVYLKETVVLIPTWPSPVAWAYFTGGAFIAAGIAVITGVWARVGAALSALMMGLFTLIIWVPIVAKGPNAGQWNEFVVSCALTAAGWVVADSYRGIPWRAVRLNR
ncbi:MAG TPA: DoxX family protein [Acidobacteriota bacterium]|nr:DoxX family protein [Acidobacteriota bacterium]